MDWTQTIDGYCERVGPGLWAEPVNALTNIAFLIAASIMGRRTGKTVLPLAHALVGLLAVIGIGSLLFHTFATRWAAVLDTVPIGLFILLYIFAANRDYWRLPVWASMLGAAAFVPYAALLTPLISALPFLQISGAYWTVPLLIAGYGVALRSCTPVTARGLLIGAGLLAGSLIFRSLDQISCATIPIGTHFVWHLLNATMLAWMIEVYRSHMLADSKARR